MHGRAVLAAGGLSAEASDAKSSGPVIEAVGTGREVELPLSEIKRLRCARSAS